MGLDMFLSVKEYVNRTDGYGPSAPKREEFNRIVADAGLDKFVNDPRTNIYGANVSVTAAYWRKANHIHNWFVLNVQRGEDDCKEYYVGVDKLKELISVCAEVLLNKDDKVFCEDLLPTGDGFFFGSTEYGEWYFDDVQYTYDRLKEIVELLESKSANGYFYDVTYQSSWQK